MPTSSARSTWLSAALLFAFYMAAGALSLTLNSGPAQSLSVWLGAAVLFAGFMRNTSSPVLFFTGWLAATVWGVMAHQLSLLPSIVFGLIEVFSAWLGALLAAQRSAQPQPLVAAARLIAGALLTAALGASLAALFWVWQATGASWQVEWRTWALSTLVGVLMLVPVVMAYQGFQVKRSGGMPMRQFLSGLIAFALFLILAWAVFSPHMQMFGTTAATLAYLPMPFLLAASMLWGPRGGSVAMLLGGLLIIARSTHGGPFAVQDSFDGEAIIEAQTFVALWAILILFGRGLEESRRLALATAQDWRLRYERTLAATGVMSVTFDPYNGAATWNPGAQQILGNHMDNLQTMGDWLSHVDAASRPLAEKAWLLACSGKPVPTDSYEVQLGASRHIVQASLAPVLGPDGTVEEIAAMVRVQQTAGV